MEPLSKSETTRAAIVDRALEIAAREGLSKLSLGGVARELGISKSGVFSRVSSLDTLQQEVLKTYERRFLERVFQPALKLPRGLPRLNSIVGNWITHICDSRLSNACLFAAGSFEFDDVGGALGERLRKGVMALRTGLCRTILQAVEAGHLRPDTDPEQLAFEIHGLILGAMHDSRFLHDKKSEQRIRNAYARIIATYRSFNDRGQD